MVEIRSLTSEIRRRKKKEERKKERKKEGRKEGKTTAAKYKPFVIAMPCGLKRLNGRRFV